MQQNTHYIYFPLARTPDVPQELLIDASLESVSVLSDFLEENGHTEFADYIRLPPLTCEMDDLQTHIHNLKVHCLKHACFGRTLFDFYRVQNIRHASFDRDTDGKFRERVPTITLQGYHYPPMRNSFLVIVETNQEQRIMIRAYDVANGKSVSVPMHWIDPMAPKIEPKVEVEKKSILGKIKKFFLGD